MNLSFETLLQWAARAVVLITAMPVHECAHGFVAHKLGDPTAESQGRLTLNPFSHLDPIGSILLILTGFGWARPVPVDSRYFRHPRRDMALTALAGPLSNILLALVTMVIYKLVLALFFSDILAIGTTFSAVQFFLSTMILVNLYLAVFNLMPLPPLDGFKFFGAIMPDRLYWKLIEMERFISIILIILLFTGTLSRPLAWVSGRLLTFIDYATLPIDYLFLR